MIIKHNVIKEYLKNVYFVTGTPCGGKTTISRSLAEKHGFTVYNADKMFNIHKELSNTNDQPAMNKEFKNADEFFFRPSDEYSKWLLDNTREQLDYIIVDLIKLSATETIVCDLHLTLAESMEFTDRSRIVFLIKNPRNVIDDYCDRADHEDFTSYINSSSNPERAKENCNYTLESINQNKYIAIKNSNHFWVERDEHSTVEKTLLAVEKHFELI